MFLIKANAYSLSAFLCNKLTSRKVYNKVVGEQYRGSWERLEGLGAEYKLCTQTVYGGSLKCLHLNYPTLSYSSLPSLPQSNIPTVILCLPIHPPPPPSRTQLLPAAPVG